jgi:hypothetical protein
MIWYGEGGYLPPECGPRVIVNDTGAPIPVMTAEQHAELGRRYIQDTYDDDSASGDSPSI